MRVEDAEQVQPVRVDPFKRFKLLIGIHHESHGTLGLIPYEQYTLH
jgi:hypothetical protein